MTDEIKQKFKEMLAKAKKTNTWRDCTKEEPPQDPVLIYVHGEPFIGYYRQDSSESYGCRLPNPEAYAVWAWGNIEGKRTVTHFMILPQLPAPPKSAPPRYDEVFIKGTAWLNGDVDDNKKDQDQEETEEEQKE